MRTRSTWWARIDVVGTTHSFHPSIRTEIARQAPRIGEAICARLMPQARIAISSLRFASAPRPSRVAASTATGMISVMIRGIFSRK